MRTFFILVFLSIVGIAVAMGTVYYNDMEKSGNSVALPSIKLPYKSFIAGTGIVEAGSKNIFIGSSVAGVIKKVLVQSGDAVHKGALLFTLDDSATRRNLAVVDATIQSAVAKLQSAKHQLAIIKKMKRLSTNMVTNEKYTKLQDNYSEAEDNLNLAKQKRKALQEELKLYKIYAPIDGIVLRSNLTVGSYFSRGSKALILGSNKLNIKVNINEFDSWKFEKDAYATAFIRGNSKQKVKLSYLYTIPMVTPKTNLTGSPTEQTDTRVLQVVYSIKNSPTFPLYVGEMLDVFIENSKGN